MHTAGLSNITYSNLFLRPCKGQGCDSRSDLSNRFSALALLDHPRAQGTPLPKPKEDGLSDILSVPLRSCWVAVAVSKLLVLSQVSCWAYHDMFAHTHTYTNGGKVSRNQPTPLDMAELEQ